MRSMFLLLLLAMATVQVQAQQTLTRSFQHNGGTREYILYIPASYDPNVPTPVVFNFHGYGSNASDQMWYGDFRPIADTANFLVVHPEGTIFQGSSHWNVGGWVNGSPVDDVGFTDVLLDTLMATYNVDANRVYSTGMSNGGFMSFLLACQLGHRFAAVASVTGSMTPETYNDCQPSHPTPVLQVHSLQDGVVPYAGAIWTKSVMDAIDYWVDYNGCATNPVYTALPNINLTDGCTAEHFVYNGGLQNTSVEHYRITGGGHTWPGTVFIGVGTNQDFNASKEIWRFFSQYTLNGLQVSAPEPAAPALKLYPLPARQAVRIHGLQQATGPYRIMDATGRLQQSGTVSHADARIDLTDLSAGLYFIEVEGQVLRLLKSE